VIVGYGVRSALGVGLCSGGGLFSVQQSMAVEVVTPRRSHDMPDLSSLPPGQARAVESLIGAGRDRTYTEAAEAAGMSLGTLYTHLRRVRCNHPKLYAAIRKVRKAQLAVRHRNAVANARAHTRAYFRHIRRSQLYLLAGYW
jgi:hypothetical protein